MTYFLDLARYFPISAKELYESFIEPERMILWFFPDGCRPRKALLEPEEGGRFLVDLEGIEEGLPDALVEGMVLEAKPGRRLVFSWNWQKGPLERLPETKVELDFEDLDNGSKLRIKQGFFTSEEFRNAHVSGWDQALKRISDSH